MTALRKAQQAAERFRYRYLHSTNGQKLVATLVELGKNWKKLQRRVTLEDDQQSQVTWT
jgi:primosomal protein N''